jgi:hypothetical protein
MSKPPELPGQENTRMEWYQHVWTGLPFLLIFLGGAIGGACGGAAWAVNRTVFLKVKHPVLRYVFTGLISVAALVLWFIIAVVALTLMRTQDT